MKRLDERIDNENERKNKFHHAELSSDTKRRIGRDHSTRSDGSFSSDSSSSTATSDDSSTSSSSSSSSDNYLPNAAVPSSVIKPLFVPKSKRGIISEIEAQQQKQAEAEEQRAKEREKRALQSRALVAEAVSAAGKKGASSTNAISGEGDEFEVIEGLEFIPVPDDSDPSEQDSPELALAERDAWEVRELIRILRDLDEALEAEKERKELERRRAMTDEERLEEDRRTGRYRAPGEARRRQRDGVDGRDGNKDEKSGTENNYLQRYHHRGAFYMDEDTLEQAGKDDVRHRAAEYSRAATGEDKIDKRALPKVMQVKKFGFAGYSTKYKGLAKEDTTDKQLDFLPIVSGGRRKNSSDEKERHRHHHNKR